MTDKVERIKEILSEVATKAVMICPAIPNIDYYAQQIADLDKLPQPDNSIPHGATCHYEREWRENERHTF